MESFRSRGACPGVTLALVAPVLVAIVQACMPTATPTPKLLAAGIASPAPTASAAATSGSGVEAPPHPGPVIPNASRIQAAVRQVSVWPPGSAQHTRHPALPNQTFYSLSIEILTSAPEQPGLENVAVPGMTYEAFSADELRSELAGKKIEATLKLTGDTRGVRWMISKVRVVP